MPKFDVRLAANALPVAAVTCPACQVTGEHLLSDLQAGTDVSCGACGRAIVVTPDNMQWVKSRAALLGIELDVPPMPWASSEKA